MSELQTIPLDLRQLFDRRYDMLSPQPIQIGRTFVRMRFINGRQSMRIPITMNGKLTYIIGVVTGDGLSQQSNKAKITWWKRYIGIVQKRFRFLVRIKKFANETIGLNFHGPFVNSRKNGKIAGWIISITKERDRTWLLRRLEHLRIS